MKSPLRYPGGKARDVKFLTQFFPPRIAEYREPFLGGGSLLLWVLENHPAVHAIGNDLNTALIEFWWVARKNPARIAGELRPLIGQYDGPHNNCPEWQEFSPWFRTQLEQCSVAARFFALNRSTSGGATESGGITAAAYCGRFTHSSIDRLLDLDLARYSDRLQFTNEDYKTLTLWHTTNVDPWEPVFLFLDPPYYSAEKSGLYGKNGNLHKGFDHARLAATLRLCPYKWLMTIDDCPHVRELYSGFHQLPWQKTYSMRRGAGAELLVANYPLDAVD